MTKNEFLDRYHSYQTRDKAIAYRDAALANEDGVEGALVLPVSFGDLGWCLMLDLAVAALDEMGILQK